jgi:hypothetical protein
VSEREDVITLANRVLDRVNADPDDDIAILARQLLRTHDRERELREALQESIKLQSHYAMLLNGWDGGKRIQFASADAWLKRLAELKKREAERLLEKSEQP